MLWLSSLRGLKVIYGTKCIGRVIQSCLTDSLAALDGIWVDRAFKGVRFISAEHICILGKTAVIVDCEGERLRMKPQSLFIRAVSTDGLRLGAITDAAIDSHTFSVRCLGLTKSWFSSLAGNTEHICRFKIEPKTGHAIILPCNEEMEV